MNNLHSFFLLLSSSEYPILLALVLLLNVSGAVLYFNLFSNIGTFITYFKNRNFFKHYFKKVVFIWYILLKTTIEDLEDIISSFGKKILIIIFSPLILLFGIFVLSFYKKIPITLYPLLMNSYLQLGLPISLNLITIILLFFFIIFNFKLLSKMLPYFLILHWVLPTGTTQCAISFTEYVEIFDREHLVKVLDHYHIPFFMVQQYKIVTLNNLITVAIFTINTFYPIFLTCLLVTNKGGMTEIASVTNTDFLVLNVLHNKIVVSENIVESTYKTLTELIYNSSYSMDYQILSFNDLFPNSHFFKYQDISLNIQNELLKSENQEKIKGYQNLLNHTTIDLDNIPNNSNTEPSKSTESPDSNSPRQTTKFLIILGSVCIVGGVVYGIKKLYFN